MLPHARAMFAESETNTQCTLAWCRLSSPLGLTFVVMFVSYSIASMVLSIYEVLLPCCLRPAGTMMLVVRRVWTHWWCASVGSWTDGYEHYERPSVLLASPRLDPLHTVHSASVVVFLHLPAEVIGAGGASGRELWLLRHGPPHEVIPATSAQCCEDVPA